MLSTKKILFSIIIKPHCAKRCTRCLPRTKDKYAASAVVYFLFRLHKIVFGAKEQKQKKNSKSCCVPIEGIEQT